MHQHAWVFTLQINFIFALMVTKVFVLNDSQV